MCNHTQKIQRFPIYISVNLQRAILIFRGDIFELVVYLVVRCVSMCEESISEDSGRISDSQNVIENRTHQIYSQKRSEIYNEKRFDLDPKSQIFAFSMCNHTQKDTAFSNLHQCEFAEGNHDFSRRYFRINLVVRCVSMCEESISEDSGRISDSQNVIENRTHQIYSQKRSEIYNEKRFDLDPKSQIFAFSMCNHTQKIQRFPIYISVNLQRAILIFRGDIFELVVCGHDFSVTQMK
eukprot:403367083